jgi:hypothetical protein
MPFVVEPCTQPECLLLEEGVDCSSLAELVVRVISGEDVSNVMTGKSPIYPQERCLDCVLRVIRGGKPGVEEYIRVGPIRLRSERRPREVILAHWQD